MKVPANNLKLNCWCKYIFSCLYVILKHLTADRIFQSFAICGLCTLNYNKIISRSEAHLAEELISTEGRAKVECGVEELKKNGILSETFMTDVIGLPIGNLNRARGTVSRRRICILDERLNVVDENEFSNTHFPCRKNETRGRQPRQPIQEVLDEMASTNSVNRLMIMEDKVERLIRKMNSSYEKNQRYNEYLLLNQPELKKPRRVSEKTLSSLYDDYTFLIYG